jgi:hypothetical protein
VVPVFEEMADGEQFTTGGASGFDVFALYKLLQMYPKAHHRVIMPWDRSQAIELCDIPRGVEVVTMPPRTTYRQRDEMIVRPFSEKLMAFPLHEEDRDVRSGTWMTTRIAQQAKLIVVVTVLEPRQGGLY